VLETSEAENQESIPQGDGPNGIRRNYYPQRWTLQQETVSSGG